MHERRRQGVVHPVLRRCPAGRTSPYDRVIMERHVRSSPPPRSWLEDRMPYPSALAALPVPHDAATPLDLMAAREQMALSLGWHIVLACFGVGLPALTLFAEWRGIRTGDLSYQLLARRWAKAMGVLFAVGAVSGTILSFEMGLLWPGLMSDVRAGDRPAVRPGGHRLLHRGDLPGHLPLRLGPAAAAHAPAVRPPDRRRRRGLGLLRRHRQRLDEPAPRIRPAGRAA